MAFNLARQEFFVKNFMQVTIHLALLSLFGQLYQLKITLLVMPSTKHLSCTTYAFIDASNIIYGARSGNWLIDQQKLYYYLQNKYQVTKAFFYYGKDSNSLKKERFLHKLSVFGYILRVKTIKHFGHKAKANCDVDLTMDMLLFRNQYSRAIVLSGDGDFTPLLAYLIKQGKQIIVITFPDRTARELKKLLGGKVQSFNDLRALLEYKKRGRP